MAGRASLRNLYRGIIFLACGGACGMQKDVYDILMCFIC